MVEDLRRLRAGEAVRCPVYDYSIHNRTDETVEVGHQVVPALQHNDIGVLAAGLDVLLVHGLNGGEITTAPTKRWRFAPPRWLSPRGFLSLRTPSCGSSVVNDADILPKVFLDFPGDGGFAAAGAPGDADNHSLSRCTHDECPLVSFYQSFGVSAAGDFAERAKLNYDHPDAFDTDRMVEDLRRLRAGEAVP